jgi:hypothetical protein
MDVRFLQREAAPMTASALLSGTLFRSAEKRTSKAGKVFVTATIKVKNGDDLHWWKILAFCEFAQAELLWFGGSDALSAQRALRIATYQKDDETNSR